METSAPQTGLAFDRDPSQIRSCGAVPNGGASQGSSPGEPRHNWTRAEVGALFALPFPELMFQAQSVHRLHFDPRAVQISTLLSIKTGGCPEDCAYCPQSAHYEAGVKADKLMEVDAVVAEARDQSASTGPVGLAVYATGHPAQIGGHTVFVLKRVTGIASSAEAAAWVRRGSIRPAGERAAIAQDSGPGKPGFCSPFEGPPNVPGSTSW